MAIVISGVNNNDKITATDGTIDLLSGVSFASTVTAPAIQSTGNLTAESINIGNNIQLGNAGVITATTFSGNLTGGASQVSVVDESLNTLNYPLFVTASVSGGTIQAANYTPKAGSNLYFNSSTGDLSATSFSGIFSGSGANLTNLPASQLTGTLPALDGSNLTGIVGGLFAGGSTGIHTTSTVGIQTANVTAPDLVGAASSMVGMYIGDGHLLFSNYLNKSGGYYISTDLNALNAGPVTLGSTMTLDGTWVIV
tara:strand:- start:2209 stop:2970 length:762 start_codon:yes stop_codon:yes gene_type:complete